MRPPAAAVLGHLVWSTTGRVWAVWRVREAPYAWLPTRRKHSEHSRVRSLLAGLPGEALVLSVAARVDPGDVVGAMTAGVELPSHPGWVDMVEATLNGLEETELYQRRHYLCVELPEGRRGRWAARWRAISGPVGWGFGLGASSPIPVREVQAAVRQADELEARLRTVPLEPVEQGEVAWLYARAVRRGLPTEPPLTGWPVPRVRWLPRGGDPAVAAPSLSALLEANFRNGGDGDDAGRPRHRRYLRVESDGVSYQTFAVVADAPQQFLFPGGASEWLYVADQLPFPIDWCCRVRAVPNQAAARSATRQQRELAAQTGQYDGEPAGPPPSLAAAMEAVDHERAELAAHPHEPELQVTMIYCLWATDLVELEQRAQVLQTLYRGCEYHVPRPTGAQLELFEAMLPGASTPQACADYRQHLLPADLAAGMPFAGAPLGDGTGLLLGTSGDTGCARPVLLDPASGPRHDRDGSIAAFGTLGSGKSYLAKRLAAAVLMRGGRMVLVDRTQAGEYVRFAHAMSTAGVASQVVTVGRHDGVLLDPLQVFRGTAAAQAAAGYLGTLCAVDPTSLEAATLARALRDVQAVGGRLLDVLDVLDGMADKGNEYRHARELAMRLRLMAENRFGAAVWAAAGRPIDAGAACTVLHLPDLAVPSREVLLSEHLSRKLLTEQVCSLGLLYLVAALARHIAYTEPGRFGALCLDEAWALTSTLPGQQLLADMCRDGRKHNAACWVLSQNPSDLPAELRDLISTRFVFGLTGAAAVDGLRWLGVEPTQYHLDVLERWAARRDPERGMGGGQAPECLLRDAAGRVGSVRVAEAETELLRAGFESNPTRLALDQQREPRPAAELRS